TDMGYVVDTAESGSAGIEALKQKPVDIVITDFRMPGMDGFEVLRQVKQISPDTEVILITAFGDIDGAVQVMREGAFDFFSKPVKLRELTASLRRTVRFQEVRKEKEQYRERLERIDGAARRRYGLDAIVGKGSAMQNVRSLIAQVWPAETTTVLVCGETGTGKELVARAIHYGSGRAGDPFVAVDCSAVPQDLFESLFYGHVKGAFTDAREARAGYFEEADGGTLFLDEIGDLPLAMQVRLLRTLEERRIRRVGGMEERPVDVRIISATNRDLTAAIASGGFRKDLYYRLNTFTISLPPLREHPEDIPMLANHFLDRFTHELHKPFSGFTPEAEDVLSRHSFPGNVRELRNILERAVILCGTDKITPEDLQIDLFSPVVPGTIPDIAERNELNLSEIEKDAIREALTRARGNRVRAAGLLGISRDALRRRMERYNIRVEGDEGSDKG
ncbi:MAG: sigma-54 dependent transcriptional regulator, partial [bacterium]|nr:sigma-54 dependent transcriptional regulator [bacterium]